mgnify:CR=1 FL=1
MSFINSILNVFVGSKSKKDLKEVEGTVKEILNFEKGKQKTLVRPVQKAYTQLEVAQDNLGKRLSIPRYNQQMKDYEAELAEQQKFDEKKAALGIVNN